MPSSHLILCCPLLLLPSMFPSIKVFSNAKTRGFHTQLDEGPEMPGKIEGRRRRGRQGIRWLDGITDSMDMGLGAQRCPVTGAGGANHGMHTCPAVVILQEMFGSIIWVTERLHFHFFDCLTSLVSFLGDCATSIQMRSQLEVPGRHEYWARQGTHRVGRYHASGHI